MISMQDKVVITGCGVVSGYGCGIHTLSESLQKGITSIRSLQGDGWYPGLVAASPPDLPTPVAATPRSSQLALLAAEEAVHNAGLSQLPAHTAFCAAIGWQPWSDADLAAHTGSHPGESFNKVHQQLGIQGPAIDCLSACAASTQSIANAAMLVQQRRTTIAIAGGADSRLHPTGILGYQKIGALAPWDQFPAHELCRPFDRDHCGFVMGEGAAFFILETETAAIARGAKVLAYIDGWAFNNDAHRLTDPAVDGQCAAACIFSALAMAAIQPEHLAAINAHGTATPVNDTSELTAWHHALNNHLPHIPITASKALLGHCSMASGAVETAACLTMMQQRFLHAQPTTTQPIHENLSTNLHRSTATQWQPGPTLKCSFGFGGQNCCLVLSPPAS